MRALVCRQYGTPDTMRIEEWDDPVPGDDEIVFDVRAAGLNFADVLMIAGKYQVKVPPPFIPGNEAAGVVSAVGRNVKRFKVGDSIIGALRGGAFAEKSAVAENAAITLPKSMNFEQGAAYSVTYGTSFHGLRQGANLQAGETVLVLGAAGGVGIAAVDIAKAMGARVIAAASSDQKLAFAREAGADETINYANQPLKETIKAMTDGRGIDVVYDPVGGDVAELALRACAWHGRYLVVGFASGNIPRLPINLVLLKEASITGVWYGTWVEKHPDEFAGNVMDLERMVDAGQLTPRYSEAFDLGDFAKAFRVITERRVLGKVVLTP